jgi:hypothetical protein
VSDVAAAPEAAPAGTASRRKKRVQPEPAVPIVPAIIVSGAPFYTLSDYEYTEVDGVTFWTAMLRLGAHNVAKVKYNGPKKPAQLVTLASASGAATEIARFEATAARLLERKDATHDMIMVLSITSETAMTPRNRVLMLKDIAGSADLALYPGLIVPA